MSHRDDGQGLRRCAAAGLISLLASLTVSLTLCNFEAIGATADRAVRAKDLY
jgi:hypothetical protein